MTPSGSINVAIVDDHRMFAECLGHLLESNDDIHVVGTAGTAEEARGLIARHRPDVVLVDYQMPDNDGLTTAHELKRFHPGVATVMLSDVDDTVAALDAINAGCSGFLPKSASADEVAGAVRASAAGEAHISSALLIRLFRAKVDRPGDPSELTMRENEVLSHLARGWTSRVIASEMGVTTSTVRNTVQSILHKLGAHSKLEAVTIAVRRGIFAYPED